MHNGIPSYLIGQAHLIDAPGSSKLTKFSTSLLTSPLRFATLGIFIHINE
jgi:hypothetical protein